MPKDLSKYVLITDLDGTLLTSNKKISDIDLASINNFVNCGGSFSVATGRVFYSAMQYVNKLPVNLPCILYNGGMIYDYNNDKVLWKSKLPSTSLEYTREILKSLSFLGAEIIIDKDIFIPQMNSILKDKLKMENVSGIECELDDIPSEWLKVLFTHDSKDTEEIIRYIDKMNCKDVSFVESFNCYYEMLPLNVSKGTALKRLADMCHLDGKTIVAAGDYNNDIEMLKAADIGVCVSNSPEKVKKSCEIVLTKTSDEGAISELINTLLN